MQSTPHRDREQDRTHRESADRRMTADRSEIKYLVPSAGARRLAEVVGQHVPRHKFAQDDAVDLSGSQSYITTVYFDTARRDVARACLGGDTSLKLRAKEYYEYFPSMAELATDSRQLIDGSAVLWLETKRRIGHRTVKNRFGIPKQDLPAFFHDGTITDEMIRIQAAEYGDAVEEVVADLAELCRPYDGPLRADCLVNYRRRAWQDDAGTLRVTLDSHLTFFAPPDDLWLRPRALTHDELGAPAGSFAGCVLELKSRGQLPAWLTDLLEETGARPATLEDAPDAAFSKFLAGSIAVHGPVTEQ